MVDRADCGVDVRISRGEDLDDVRVVVGNLRKESDTRFIRHALVGDDDADLVGVLAEHGERLDAILRLEDAEFFTKKATEVFAGVRLVIHEEDGVALIVVGVDLVTHGVDGKGVSEVAGGKD